MFDDVFNNKCNTIKCAKYFLELQGMWKNLYWYQKKIVCMFCKIKK